MYLSVGSQVSSLNELALVIIEDQVLGGWSLLKEWQLECAKDLDVNFNEIPDSAGTSSSSSYDE